MYVVVFVFVVVAATNKCHFVLNMLIRTLLVQYQVVKYRKVLAITNI